MSIFSRKLNSIAKDTNSYLKKFFSKQKSNSRLLLPMKYGVFSGGKRFRSSIIINTGIIIVAIVCIIINIYRLIMRPSCAGSTFSGVSCFIAS